MPEDFKLPGPEYLGDGLYASFDGYYINLTVGDHRNPPLVAIEPEVMQALKAYAERCWRPENA